MKIANRNLVALLLFGVVLSACSGGDEIDTDPPIISSSFEGAFPIQCDELVRGETYTVQFEFTDNFELGAFSLDIHHNFDHHTHSTEVNECSLDPKKNPVNPWVLVQDYSIPNGLKTYRTSISLTVPDDVDTGDYHFMVKLTDKEGWQTISGIQIFVR